MVKTCLNPGLPGPLQLEELFDQADVTRRRRR
jgi:hypothetical protein